MHNLLVELDGKRFGARALASAVRAIERAGFRVEWLPADAGRSTPLRSAHGRSIPHDDNAEPHDDNRGNDNALYAWIDEEFGGTWSSEAFAGKNVVAKKDDRFAGFATFDPQGLRFLWLRGLAKEEGVGVFGPFGVAPEFRGSPIGLNLLKAALCALRQAGYKRALIGAVGHPKLIEYYAKHSGARIAETFDLDALRKQRIRTVVFASGEGTNFQAIADEVAAAKLPLDLRLLVCNNPQAKVLTRARIANIRSALVPWDRPAQSRASYDLRLLAQVQEEDAELILLLGWMHILDRAFIQAFPDAINIHPAFLPLDQSRDDVVFPDGSSAPAFRGSRAVRDALAWGCRWTGATAHRVSLDADRGPVLVRKLLALLPGDTEEKVMGRLHPLEHRVLAGGILRWLYER